MSIEKISTTTIPFIDVHNIAQIFGKIFPSTTSGALPLNTTQIQGWISITPPTIVSSISTYTNSKVTTTMLPTSNVIPSLGASNSIPNTFYRISCHISYNFTNYNHSTHFTFAHIYTSTLFTSILEHKK